MISEKENTRISKFLSLVLRHKPDAIGIQLDDNGWTNVRALLLAMNSNGFKVTREVVEHVVSPNNKSRFAFNADKTMIRASQGHSIEVSLGYEPMKPPLFLFHGTAEGSVASVLTSGLEKRSRHHVHLSAEKSTAIDVGKRYGKPVVLRVAAEQMHDDGFSFYQSENNVWLTDHVPPKYLAIEGESR